METELRNYNRDTNRIELSKKLVALLTTEFENEYPQDQIDLEKKPFPPQPEGFPTTLNLKKAEMANLKIHPLVLSVLCGTLLGDGSLKLQKGYRNARFQYRHSTRQTEWFMWKTLGALKEFIGNEGIQFQLPDGEQKKTRPIGGECLGKLKVSSKSLEKLSSLHQILCQKNQLVIERHWLNHMNAYFLMTLWLDDGSLVNKQKGYFCLDSTPEKELQVLADYLKSVWKIDCKVQQVDSKKNHYRILISDDENLYKLMQIIAPLIPVKSMLYKVCFTPTDANLQQRWTTEMKKLVRKEWHDEIDKQNFYTAIQRTDRNSREEESKQ